MACSSSSVVVKDFLNINGCCSSPISSNDDSSAAANIDKNELFVGSSGTSFKLRTTGMFQTMDLFHNNINFTGKNLSSSNTDHAGGRISGKTVARTMKDVHHHHHHHHHHNNESGGGDGGYGGGGIRGRRTIPLSNNIIPNWVRPNGHSGGSRPPSLLELSLFPEFKRDVRFPIPSSGEDVETAQMTIFYAGIINVYDNVPADKAEAVMLLANQCSVSSSAPIVQGTKTLMNHHSTPSLGNDPEELPIARRQSLKRFLEKRRGRIINKFPYANSDDI